VTHRSEQLDIDRTSEAYVESGRFSVKQMVSFLSGRLSRAAESEFPRLRAAGEMSWVLPEPGGAEDFFVYESTVNKWLLEISRDAEGGLWFEPSQVSAMARIQRLHRELNLSYASLGLIIDLLDRITQLERLQRSNRQGRARGGDRWT